MYVLQLKETRMEKDALASDNESLHLRVDELSEGAVEVKSLKKQIDYLQPAFETLQNICYK